MFWATARRRFILPSKVYVDSGEREGGHEGGLPAPKFSVKKTLDSGKVEIVRPGKELTDSSSLTAVFRVVEF